MSSRFRRNRTPSAGRSSRWSAPGGRSTAGSLWRPSLLGVSLLALAYLAVAYDAAGVVGVRAVLVVETAVVVLAATAVARYLDARRAMAVSAALGGVGLALYFFSLPESQRALFSVETVARDLASLLTGLSVLRLTELGAWLTTVLPAPTFAAWFLAVRGRTADAVAVAGAVLGFFVLTGDAGTVVTLIGVGGGLLALALETLASVEALSGQWDTLVVVLAATVVVTTAAPVLPGGGAGPLFGPGATPSQETSLVAAGDSLGVVGGITLSPEVRFVVDADRRSYWKTGSFDRYTGDGWTRTGEADPYGDELSGPPGESARLEQTVTPRTPLNAMPAAWKPTGVAGVDGVEVLSGGGLRASDAVEANESYRVVSRTPVYGEADLRAAGRDYPEAVESRYTQLPEVTPDRVERRTETIIDDAGADTPYDAAVAIERYLEAEKEYSLSVERPSGTVADEFLFEMDAGYCTYYATTMVTMLRSQDVPARFVTGYTPGEQVDEDRWVVRGLDAHAWVEVYFPGVGWVPFDPTPAAERAGVEADRVEQARENDADGVDAAGSGDSTPTPTATPTPSDSETEPGGTLPGALPSPEQEDGIGGETPDGGGVDGLGSPVPDDDEAATATETATGGGGGVGSVDPETVGYTAVAVVGLAAAARRAGLTGRLRRGAALRYQRRVDPATDAERAFRRLETLFGRRYRPRRPGETPREYVTVLVEARDADERAETVLAAYERARYGDEVDPDAAAAAVAAVDGLVGGTAPLAGRLLGER